MKKEIVTGNRVLRWITALIPFVLFLQGAYEVQAAVKDQGPVNYHISEKESVEVIRIPGKKISRTIPLSADKTTQIPRYIVEEGMAYVLDEASIALEETGRSSSEGADVVTTGRYVEGLPDNDLERIEKTIIYEGITCDLLCVAYEVTGEDEDGIPVEYSAVCEYGGLKAYEKSYPSAWQAVVWYDACRIVGNVEVLTEMEEYGNTDVSLAGSVKTVQGDGRTGREAEAEAEPEAPAPKPSVKKFQLRKITPGDGEEENEFPDLTAPLTAAAAIILLLIPLLVWFTILTAPLFALRKGERYRYIGQVRVKKEEAFYTAYLTERLIARADIPVFKIKVPRQVRKETEGGVLQVNCPDGKRLSLICGEEVGFTLERG